MEKRKPAVFNPAIEEYIPYDEPLETIAVQTTRKRRLHLSSRALPIAIKSEADLVCADNRPSFKMKQSERYRTEAIRDICRQCPLQAECLEFGLIQPRLGFKYLRINDVERTDCHQESSQGLAGNRKR